MLQALRSLRFVVLLGGLLFCFVGVPAEAASPKKASRIVIKKSAHTMQLLGVNDEVLASYDVSIGPGGAGHKRQEGDRITPVGRYHVTLRHPSRFKIFMRLDYPNAQDRERFKRAKRTGELPAAATIGGDIGIHGGTPSSLKSQDWTLGCVAVSDEEIVAIAKLVPDGVVVDIED
jgi:murein L,D-transpeptidase YafK